MVLNIIIAVIIFISIVIYVSCAAVKVCDAYNQTRTELARANSRKSKRYWRRKLWLLRLKIIPFGVIIIKLTGLEKRHRKK